MSDRERQAAEGYLKATGLAIPAAMDHLKGDLYAANPRDPRTIAEQAVMRGLREIQKERRAKRGPRK